MGLYISLHISEIDRIVICLALDVDATFLITFLCYLVEHHAEEKREESWSQDLPCFTPLVIGNGSERFRLG